MIRNRNMKTLVKFSYGIMVIFYAFTMLFYTLHFVINMTLKNVILKCYLKIKPFSLRLMPFDYLLLLDFFWNFPSYPFSPTFIQNVATTYLLPHSKSCHN